MKCPICNSELVLKSELEESICPNNHYSSTHQRDSEGYKVTESIGHYRIVWEILEPNRSVSIIIQAQKVSDISENVMNAISDSVIAHVKQIEESQQ